MAMSKDTIVKGYQKKFLEVYLLAAGKSLENAIAETHISQEIFDIWKSDHDFAEVLESRENGHLERRDAINKKYQGIFSMVPDNVETALRLTKEVLAARSDVVVPAVVADSSSAPVIAPPEVITSEVVRGVDAPATLAENALWQKNMNTLRALYQQIATSRRPEDTVLKETLVLLASETPHSSVSKLLQELGAPETIYRKLKKTSDDPNYSGNSLMGWRQNPEYKKALNDLSQRALNLTREVSITSQAPFSSASPSSPFISALTEEFLSLKNSRDDDDTAKKQAIFFTMYQTYRNTSEVFRMLGSSESNVHTWIAGRVSEFQQAYHLVKRGNDHWKKIPVYAKALEQLNHVIKSEPAVPTIAPDLTISTSESARATDRGKEKTPEPVIVATGVEPPLSSEKEQLTQSFAERVRPEGRIYMPTAYEIDTALAQRKLLGEDSRQEFAALSAEFERKKAEKKNLFGNQAPRR